MTTTPARQTSEPELRPYNKLDGLRFLERRTSGIRGVRVLPYRVYDDPAEFDFAHFQPRPERFLVRTNLDGEVSHSQWGSLPRQDAKPRRVMRKGWLGWLRAFAPHPRIVMEKMKASWSEEPAYHIPLQFIVHPVFNRNATRLLGSIRFNCDERKHNAVLTIAKPGNPKADVWRNFHVDGNRQVFSKNTPLTSKNARAIENMLSDVLEGDERRQAARGLLSTIRAIRAHLDATRPLCNGEYLEANFSIDRDSIPTFYDATRRD